MGSNLADWSLIHHVTGVRLQSAHGGFHALMLFRAECKWQLLKTELIIFPSWSQNLNPGEG